MQFLKTWSKGKQIIRIIGMMILPIYLLTSCTSTPPSLQHEQISEETSSSENAINTYESPFSVTRADLNTDDSSASHIDLSTVSDRYVISDAGDYLLTGALDGSICVDAEEQVVHLIFDGIDIHSYTGPALSVISASKVIITVKSDTVNTLRDSGYYDVSGEENACIYSVSDLTINGDGVLNIYGFYMDAIHSKDVVKILGGEISILSKRDGIRGNDGILVRTDILSIESESSGLHTTKTSSNIQGDIEISGGDLSIISGDYAISSVGSLYVSECSIYCKGILANYHVGGNLTIQEGCLKNE